MAGFGTELLLFCGLGYVVLGPQRMQALLQSIAHAKAEFEKTQRANTSELVPHPEARDQEDRISRT